MHYILDENKNVIDCTLEQWGEFFQSPDRVLKQEVAGDYWVSTVFLGLDHRFGGDPHASPIVFETMVFQGRRGKRRDVDCRRYSTYEEAMKGHQELVDEWRNK